MQSVMAVCGDAQPPLDRLASVTQGPGSAAGKDLCSGRPPQLSPEAEPPTLHTRCSLSAPDWSLASELTSKLPLTSSSNRKKDGTNFLFSVILRVLMERAKTLDMQEHDGSMPAYCILHTAYGAGHSRVYTVLMFARAERPWRGGNAIGAHASFCDPPHGPWPCSPSVLAHSDALPTSDHVRPCAPSCDSP